MLKTTENTKYAANFKKTKGEIDGNSMVDNSMIGGNKTTNQANSIKGKNQIKTTNSKILVKSRNKEAGTGFFIFEARLAFI